jgi:hypothetical protein
MGLPSDGHRSICQDAIRRWPVSDALASIDGDVKPSFGIARRNSARPVDVYAEIATCLPESLRDVLRGAFDYSAPACIEPAALKG